MSTGGTPRRRALAVLACIVAALAFTASPAAAHDELVGTTPPDGSTGGTAPDQVVLSFTEPAVALGTEVVVTGPDGTDVAVGAVQLVDATVVQPLTTNRPAGTYRVDWRVTSADGHPVSGTFTFTAAAATPAPTGSMPAPAPGTAAASPVSAPATSTPAAPPPDTTGTTPPTAPAAARSRLGLGLVLAAAALLLVAVRIGRVRSLRRKGQGAGDGPAGGA